MIDTINATPHEDLRFRDFLCLKSGRDSFSRIRLKELTTLVSIYALDSVREAFEHESDQAKCLRWILRGLDTDKAIRKVKTDNEVTMNAISARRVA